MKLLHVVLVPANYYSEVKICMSNVCLSNGSNPQKWGFENFSEPWLKVLFLGVRAMAQSLIIFEVIKAPQFWSFFHTSHSFCNWVHQVCQFANLQKQKGIRLGSLFSNPISLVTLRSLFTISGQPKFLIPSPVYILPCTFLFITFIMDHTVQSNNISSN